MTQENSFQKGFGFILGSMVAIGFMYILYLMISKIPDAIIWFNNLGLNSIQKTVIFGLFSVIMIVSTVTNMRGDML